LAALARSVVRLLAALLIGVVDTFGKVIFAAGFWRTGLRFDGADPAVEA
jgi:hypothetical protein